MDPVEEEKIVVCASTIFLAYGCHEVLKKKKKKRRIWVKEWLAEREAKGGYNLLVSQLMQTDTLDYRRFMRMNVETFQANVIIDFTPPPPRGIWLGGRV